MNYLIDLACVWRENRNLKSRSESLLHLNANGHGLAIISNFTHHLTEADSYKVVFCIVNIFIFQSIVKND